MNRIANGVRNYVRAAAPSNGGNVNPFAQVKNILRKYGTDAHVYLPGIGVINGLTAGNYLDSAGTTAATVDNPVGLVLDGAGSVGSELVVNGDFSNGTTGWTAVGSPLPTLTNASNELVITTTANAGAYGAQQILTTVIGKSYNITATLRNGTASDVRLRAVNSIYTGTILAESSVVTSTTNTQINLIFVATSTQSAIYLRIATTGASVVGYFDNISVKEVTGIHALQATTANKTILRRGAVNLLTYSEQFDNASGWTNTNVTITANSVNNPITGTQTADLLIANANLGDHRLLNVPTIVSGQTYTASVYAKQGAGTLLLAFRGMGTAGSAGQFPVFNLQNGTVTTAGSLWSNATITSIGNGWYRCSATTTAAATTSLYITLMQDATTFSFAGDASSGIYVWGAQLQTGSVVTDYIPTTTAAASSATGNYHWVHDSTDLLTATFPAGYESATTINAASTGQSTLTAQNIVGAYNIGPSIDTYGRFIFRTGLTASELAIMQQFANRLAGV